MPQLLLNCVQVSSLAQHMNCGAVAQSSRSDLGSQVGCLGMGPEYLPQTLSGKTLPQAIQKQRLLVMVLRHLGAGVLNIISQRVECFSGQEKHSGLGVSPYDVDACSLNVSIL